jgi:hypothetical protein
LHKFKNLRLSIHINILGEIFILWLNFLEF